MNKMLRTALAVAGLAAAAPALANITFYEGEGFQGRSFTTQGPVSDFARVGFNDRASSVIVVGDRWEACDNAGFGGNCRVLRPGSYPSLAAMGMGDRISSVRIVSREAKYDDQRYAPAPFVVNDYRRRDRERIYEANVTSVRAVVGPPEQRCWVERGQAEDRSQGNIVGGVTGAVIGGILGHQVGSGRGKDVATVGGALAGGAIGMNVGRDNGGHAAFTPDVQRCQDVTARAPEYWDVTYSFRGKEHRMQTATRPGAVVQVNEAGEPRA